jgi:glycosyltransferase involved in cell wall biosynthesis
MNNPWQALRQPYKSVLFILSGSVSDFRMTLAARNLVEKGYHVEVISGNVPIFKMLHYDVTICERPFMDICRFIKMAVEAGRKVIIDMDDDFYSIPPENPAYKSLGKGNAAYISVLKEAITVASGLVVASPELIGRYGREATVIPNCYNEENVLWSKPHPKRDKVNIGWVGTATHREDMLLVKDALMKLAGEREDVKVVIGGDYEIFKLFYDLPEHKKLFIPYAPYEQYPAFYYNLDILVAPLIDNNFNRAKSDIKLVEAGAAGIPYICSDIPMYHDYWKQYGGGWLCGPDAWYNLLLAMVEKKTERFNIGMQGLDSVVMNRQSNNLTSKWEGVL